MWIILPLIAVLVFPPLVQAQSTGDLYRLAVEAGTAYRQAHDQYVSAKNQYLQYGSGQTRIEAIAKTNSVLVARNVWQIAYLKYLRQLLAEVTLVASYPQTTAYLDLETQITELSALAAQIGQSDTFEEITAESKAWEKRLTQTDKLTTASQLQIAAARLANWQKELTGQIGDYRTSHPQPTSSQQTTLDLIAAKLDSSVQIRSQVDQQLGMYKSGSWSKYSAQRDLSQSYRLLYDAARLLLELEQKS